MPNFNLQEYLEKTENEFRERFGEFVVEKNNRIVASEEGVLQFLRSAIETAVKEAMNEIGLHFKLGYSLCIRLEKEGEIILSNKAKQEIDNFIDCDKKNI